MKPGIYPELDEVTYPADPDSISASRIKRILRSPAHFKMAPERTEAMDFGTAFHTTVLGVGPEIIYVDAASWRGKAAADERAEAWSNGTTPLLVKDAALIQGMADSVRAHPSAAQLINLCKPEVSMFWDDPEWSIQRRCRFDLLDEDSGVSVDLKSTSAGVSFADISRAIVRFGYDFSAAWYEATARGCGVNVTASALIFCDTKPPHQVRVVELSEDFIQRGRAHITKALTAYQQATETDAWPAYDDPGYSTIHPPKWAREETA